MIERVQDLFAQINNPATATCITTNGIVKEHSGMAVMGAGVAKLVRDKYLYCDIILGALISQNGNIVQQFLTRPVVLIAFPTKNNYTEISSLQIIEQSAHQLKEWADNHPQFTAIVLPRPGTNNGGLIWEDVKPILEKILAEDKFVIIHKE